MTARIVIDDETNQSFEFEDTWEEIYPILIGRARKIAADSDQDPEDLVSQATLKVLKYVSLGQEVENLVGLMLVSLMHVYQDDNRKAGNRIFVDSNQLIEDSDHYEYRSRTPGAEREFIAKQTLGGILDYITATPSSCQELFQMRFVHDMSYAEISHRLNISEACARQRVKTLRMKIRDLSED